MRVYDPTTNRHVEWDACFTLPESDGYVPTRSAAGDWFAVNVASGIGRPLAAAPATVARAVIAEEAASRLAWAAGEPGVDPMPVADLRAARALAVEEYGLPVVEAAERACGADPGYADSSWHRLFVGSVVEDYEPTGPELAEGVDDKHVLKAVFLVGGGGSGKSRVGHEMFAGTGMKVLNPDTHVERILKAEKIPPAKLGDHKGVFDRARKTKDKEQKLYSSRRLGLVIDGTGWSYERIANPVESLRALGYDCSMVFVTTSAETAHARNDARAAGGGRKVPSSEIQFAWDGAHDNLGRYRKLFGKGRFFLVDNDADVTPLEWKNRVVPALRKIANKILRTPLANPVGLKWVADQGGGKSDGVRYSEAKARRIDKREKKKKASAAELFGGAPRKASSAKLAESEDGVDAWQLLDEGDSDGPVNRGAAKALVGYIRSSMKAEYVAQVVRPIALYKKKGTYDHAKSPKLAYHLVIKAGRQKEGPNYHETLNPPTRAAAEVMVRDAAVKDAAAGMADATLPKKFQPGFKGYGKSESSTSAFDFIDA